MEEIIESFAAQGWHRTGSSTDRRSAQWLAQRVAMLGITAELRPFTFRRYIPSQAFIEVAGRETAGLTCFDAPDTPARGISGTLTATDDQRPGAIGLIVAGPHGAGGDEIDRHRRSGVFRALVVVSAGARPGLAPRNAESAEEPFGVPVLQVGSAARSWLEDVARDRGQATVLTSGRTEAGASANVVVGGSEIAGTGPLIVLTPRSGWWHCAAERGGGLVCWLEAMRVLDAEPGARPVMYLATSGHELGYLGLRRALSADLGQIGDGALWLHLGANLGARGGSVRLTASDAGLASLGTSVLEGGGCRLAGPPSIGGAMGEGSVLARRGARYISVVGTNDWFHLRSDRWPDSVDDAEVGRLARATSALAGILRDAVTGGS
ncbi:MAG: hypothetical protein NVS3B12_05950 [Acidimicrobiales bacterium]